MTLRELPGAIDRMQRGRLFKVAASVALVLIVGGLFTWYAVALSSGQTGGAAAVLERLGEQGASIDDDARVRIVRGVLQDASSLTAVAVGAAAILGIGLLVVWLGLGMTYLIFGLLAAAVAVPLALFDSTEVYARLIIGVVSLAAAFTALMQALRLAMGGPGPVLGVARNLLTEAVRMKISLVFIILLILGLAVLPGLLDAEQPLRYRVQSFFQYSVAGTFWLLAILTLAFGVASITGEQREKVIWQTVTKPVAKWQYLFGKWLGIVSLNAVLLLVCASGVFLFAEYLRNQPAVGESQAYFAEDSVVSEDRFILETRVLTARESRFLPTPDELKKDSPEFEKYIEEYIEAERIIDPDFASTPQMRTKVVDQLHEKAVRAARSVGNAQSRIFEIPGLSEAKASNSPLTLSLRIDAMGNRPDLFYTLSFVLMNRPTDPPLIKNFGLGFFHNISISPDAINDEGVLEIMIINGEFGLDRSGAAVVAPNRSAFLIPDEGLEIAYEAGSYRLNFARVMFVMWLKLAFLAMVAVFASTFLSFPVACLVAFGIFVLAEMSEFLITAVEGFDLNDREGNLILYRAIVSEITWYLASGFRQYENLDPAKYLVTGRLLPWSRVIGGTAALAVASAVLFALSVFIFRRRELATYSGQ